MSEEVTDEADEADEVVADPEADDSEAGDAEPEPDAVVSASSSSADPFVVADREESTDDEAAAGAGSAGLTMDDVLTAATAERDEFRDHLVRLQADFDNYRKRAQKELAEAGDKAVGRFIEKLLPVLDAVDSARVHAHNTSDVDQVAGLLLDLLAKQGLERLGAEGDVFDPTRHEAVVHEAGDNDVQTVAQLLRAGWHWRGRVLRPAMVKVVGG